MQLPCEFLLFNSLSHRSLLLHFTRLPAPAVHSQTHSDQLHVINLAICQLVYIGFESRAWNFSFDASKYLTTLPPQLNPSSFSSDLVSEYDVAMDTGSDSPVLIVQRSPPNLSFNAHQPLADFALPVDPPSHRTPPSATNQEPPSTFTMSQPETLQIAHPTAHSAPSEAAIVDANTATMASTAVELATTGSVDSPPATTPSTNTTELSPQPDLLQETQADV